MSKRWLLLSLVALSPCIYWLLRNAVTFWWWFYDVVTPALLWISSNTFLAIYILVVIGGGFLILWKYPGLKKVSGPSIRKTRLERKQLTLAEWKAGEKRIYGKAQKSPRIIRKAGVLVDRGTGEILEEEK